MTVNSVIPLVKSLDHYPKFDWMLAKLNLGVFRAAVSAPEQHKIG